MTFKDHFSAGSDAYAQHRPHYPAALFARLAALAPSRQHAVDVATGTGQAATGLAAHFRQVSAFDASAAQIAAAEPRPNIRYGVAPAEALPVPDAGVDLLTVAQALHWLDAERFHAEVRRVLVPGGVIAVWTYNLLEIDPAVDALVHTLYHDTLGDYWPAERRHVEDGYATLPFPYRPVSTADFAESAVCMTVEWNADRLLDYLRTWSAWRQYVAAGHPDPVTALAARMHAAFGPGTRRVNWPLTLRAGTP